MSPVPILIACLLIAGCAIPPQGKPKPALQPSAVPAAPIQATKVVETRFEVRGYTDPVDSTVRHTPHAVYRKTRVPLGSPTTEIASRSEHAPASFAPLPASDELAAELSTQKKISVELPALQAALADAEEKMKRQYATLVRQSAETLKLRDQLESERSRLKESSFLASPVPGAASTSVTSNEVKW